MAGDGWRGDMLADAPWNERTRLQDIVHYDRPDDVFRRQKAYWRPDADMFDHQDRQQAPRADLFTAKPLRNRPDKLFNRNF